MNVLPFARASDIEAIALAQRWLVEGLWGDGDVGILGGEPKSYKSFLAQQIAVAVASGTPCLGRFAVPEPGPVLMFAAEDALHTVRCRLDGICAQAGIALDRLDLWVVTAPTVRLDRVADCEALDNTLCQLQPRLVVLDPFVRLHRVDENASAAVAPLLAVLREFQRKHGCAILVVHHARKGGAARAGQALRGSSEFHAWGDVTLFLQRTRGGLRLSAEHRAGPGLDEVLLELRDGPHGPSLALRSVSPVAEPPPDDARTRVLAALHAADKPQSARQIREVSRLRMSTLLGVVTDLASTGTIERTPTGWAPVSHHPPPTPPGKRKPETLAEKT